MGEYEGKAIMVIGVLPEHKGWLYEANVIDQGGSLMTEVVKVALQVDQLFRKGSRSLNF